MNSSQSITQVSTTQILSPTLSTTETADSTLDTYELDIRTKMFATIVFLGFRWLNLPKHTHIACLDARRYFQTSLSEKLETIEINIQKNMLALVEQTNFHKSIPHILKQNILYPLMNHALGILRVNLLALDLLFHEKKVSEAHLKLKQIKIQLTNIKILSKILRKVSSTVEREAFLQLLENSCITYSKPRGRKRLWNGYEEQNSSILPSPLLHGFTSLNDRKTYVKIKRSITAAILHLSAQEKIPRPKKFPIPQYLFCQHNLLQKVMRHGKALISHNPDIEKFRLKGEDQRNINKVFKLLDIAYFKAVNDEEVQDDEKEASGILEKTVYDVVCLFGDNKLFAPTALTSIPIPGNTFYAKRPVWKIKSNSEELTFETFSYDLIRGSYQRRLSGMTLHQYSTTRRPFADLPSRLKIIRNLQWNENPNCENGEFGYLDNLNDMVRTSTDPSGIFNNTKALRKVLKTLCIEKSHPYANKLLKSIGLKLFIPYTNKKYGSLLTYLSKDDELQKMLEYLKTLGICTQSTLSSSQLKKLTILVNHSQNYKLREILNACNLLAIREILAPIARFSLIDAILVSILIGNPDGHGLNYFVTLFGEIISFDHGRCLTNGNGYISRGDHVYPSYRSSLLELDGCFTPLTLEERCYIKEKVAHYESKIPELEAYLNDKVIKKRLSLVPIDWLNPKQALQAMKERIAWLGIACKSNRIVNLRDFTLYAINGYRFPVALSAAVNILQQSNYRLREFQDEDYLESLQTIDHVIEIQKTLPIYANIAYDDETKKIQELLNVGVDVAYIKELAENPNLNCDEMILWVIKELQAVKSKPPSLEKLNWNTKRALPIIDYILSTATIDNKD